MWTAISRRLFQKALPADNIDVARHRRDVNYDAEAHLLRFRQGKISYRARS